MLTGQGGLFLFTPWEAVGALLVTGALTAVAQITLAQALSLTTVASAATINGMNPVLAALLAFFLLGEPLNLLMVLGTLLTVAGVIYVQATKPEVGTVTQEMAGD